MKELAQILEELELARIESILIYGTASRYHDCLPPEKSGWQIFEERIQQVGEEQ
jgi:hypothetical protein